MTESDPFDTTMAERDAAEDAISLAYCIVTGSSPEWSNVFGFPDALDEISGVQYALRAEITTLRARLAAKEAALREAMEATERHPLSVGFAHGPATRQELAERLSEIRAILEAALAAYDATQEKSDAT